MMQKLIIGLTAAAAALTGCTGDGRPGYASDSSWRSYRQYDYNRPDPAYNGYNAERYYRDAPSYRERALRRNDRVYRGQNGQYYCRRSDGTTGLIVGGIAGGAIGSAIAPGGSELLGALLGGVAGAAGGQAIDRNGARCR